MARISSIASNRSRSFKDGVLDGWQSVNPFTLPNVAYLPTPAGFTPYQFGFKVGSDHANTQNARRFCLVEGVLDLA